MFKGRSLFGACIAVASLLSFQVQAESKRISARIVFNELGAYVEVVDNYANHPHPIVLAIPGDAPLVSERALVNATKGGTDCDLSVDEPSGGGAVDGQVTSLASSCTVRHADGSIWVYTMTVTFKYDAATGTWSVLDSSMAAPRKIDKPKEQ